VTSKSIAQCIWEGWAQGGRRLNGVSHGHAKAITQHFNFVDVW